MRINLKITICFYVLSVFQLRVGMAMVDSFPIITNYSVEYQSATEGLLNQPMNFSNWKGTIITEREQNSFTMSIIQDSLFQFGFKTSWNNMDLRSTPQGKPIYLHRDYEIEFLQDLSLSEIEQDESWDPNMSYDEMKEWKIQRLEEKRAKSSLYFEEQMKLLFQALLFDEYEEQKELKTALYAMMMKKPFGFDQFRKDKASGKIKFKLRTEEGRFENNSRNTQITGLINKQHAKDEAYLECMFESFQITSCCEARLHAFLYLKKN